MPTFIYTAIDDEGKISSGELEVADKKFVINYLSGQGLVTVSVKPKKNDEKRISAFSVFGISFQDKIMITKNLSTIIRSGLSLKEGIETILRDTKKKTFRKILFEIKFNLEKGKSLSVTFKKYPKVFSNIFVALIEAGEYSGTLENSLEHLGDQLRKEYRLKQKIKSAMIYPAILLFASVGVIVVMMIFVVPRLTKSFSQNNIELPWTTQLLINISKFISNNFLLIGGVFAIVIILFLYFRKEKIVQMTISEVIVRIPVISNLYKKIIFARFTRTLGTLLESGIGILKAIEISSEAIGYNKYQRVVKNLRPKISRGVSLGNALEQEGVFPYMIINMVRVGEKTGNLDSILKELANFYEEEVDNSLKNLISVLEPFLLLIMGLIVAFVAFSVIMPMYQMVGSVR